MKSRLLSTVYICIITFVSLPTHAVPVSGQGTWESTLEGRDLDDNAATFEAYYDATLDITWLADANLAVTNQFGLTLSWGSSDTTPNTVGNTGRMIGANMFAWIDSMNAYNYLGFNDWRLPIISPINGSTYDWSFTADATSDRGAAPTTTDGTDGGWRDDSGNPVSEMGHMFYVTLGNFANGGLDNTGPFSNVQPDSYLSGTGGRAFDFRTGDQGSNISIPNRFAWAVRSGDVGAVPLPAAVWLFGSGLLSLVGIARRKAT